MSKIWCFLKKRPLRAASLLLIAVLATSALFGGSILAKYVREQTERGPVKALEFYVESDLLTEEGKTYELQAGTASVSFSLQNYIGTGEYQRLSEVPITYTVKVEGTEGATVHPTDNGEGATSEYTATALANAATDTNLTVSNLKPGGTYTVTVTANGGYEKTLKATFKVKAAEDGFFMHVDDSDANVVILTVWTQNISGDVTITPVSGNTLIPDNTCAGLEKMTVGGEVTIENFGTYTAKEFRFFKPSEYAGNANFTVTLTLADHSIKTAAEGTP